MTTDIKIRNATDNDCKAICQLHIASIKHFCFNFYPAASIQAWTALKSPEIYKNVLGHKVFIVAEKNTKIIGFGLLNLQKKSIDSLYLAPNCERKGYGKALVTKLEEIALNHGIKELTLSSTLNAIDFYHCMGYAGDIKSTCPLSSRVQLECIDLSKKLTA